MGSKIFALVDCNNFYASCERLFNPALCGEPIIVLSNNEGCVISRSEEAKKLGIQMGVPFFQIKALCEKEGVKVFSSNFSFYGDMSARVMNCIADFTPNMEIYSIDEAFLDLTGFADNDLIEYALKINERVEQWTGIPVSVGIGPTKTLAKLANIFAKKQQQQNIFSLQDSKTREYIMRLSDVGDVWGVGSKLAERLKSIGVKSAWDLAIANDDVIKSLFSVSQLRIIYELRGISCLEMSDVAPKKSITSSRSFGEVITLKGDIEEYISRFVAKAAGRLRLQGSLASAIYVYIKTNKFDQRNQYISDSALVTFPVATNNTSELIKYAKEALCRIYKQGSGYKKAGIVLLDLIDQNKIQYDMLSHVDIKKNNILMKMLDRINKKEGKGIVKFAAEGVKGLIRSQSLPRYTASWSDLPRVV